MSFLNNIFGTKPKTDFSVLQTDVHSHFLPGLDDGCKTFEESIRLLKSMHEAGFRNIVCTPHIQAVHYQNSRETIMPVFEQLQLLVEKEIPGLSLSVAAEYLLDDGFEKHLENGLMTFGKENYVLTELSYFTPYPRYRNLLQQIQMKGFKPILAHPERYGYWAKHDEPIEELHGAGILLQVNIPSLTDYYGSTIRKRAFGLVEKGLVSLAGSDIHNANYLNSVLGGLQQRSLSKILEQNRFANCELM
ncbi:MAG: capsular biosynthesis protein [Bacteroidetes bacterium HGW-Bacteroidetes-6]|jgi:tyrosine-protein phosphatase YwqE|nr:MAG: capsular biosynthesis protein [Bacteroidetes bacterium HGW-Bacteroidetes-6]